MKQLEAKNVNCGYREELVLEQLSLAAKGGEVLALVGPNGSGKTTLLRALGRLLKPRGGHVLIEESDVWQLKSRDVARRVALTPQTERRDWPLTVEQSVSLGRAPHRGWLLPLNDNDRSIVAQSIESVGLTDNALRPITELSGGEWRRMILARALAQQAEVLLLDEPTAGLDLKYQAQTLQLTRDLTRELQLAVVLTIHDLNHAAMFADRIAMLHDGNIVAVGSPDEVLTEGLIQATYGVPVVVSRHPLHNTPLVLLAADQT